MKADLMIIDYDLNGYRRYAWGICRNLKASNKKLTIVGGYVSGTGAEYMCHFPEIDELFGIMEVNIDTLFEKYQPRAVLVFAHRIIDYLFTIEAHRRGILVFNFQHGMYMDSTVVSKFTLKGFYTFYKSKKEKMSVYSHCIEQLTQGRRKDIVEIVMELLRGKSLYAVFNRKYENFCTADISFVYGNYWKQYYEKRYMENKKFIIVGYPELEVGSSLIPDEYFSDESLPVLCYLAQSSVEDGIVEIKIMQSFFERLLPLLRNVNLLIKLHPRSNKDMYKVFTESKYANHVRLWESDDFPIADMYIGHESTVLAKAIYITDKTLIYKLVEGRNSLFSSYAKYHADSNSNLAETVRNMFNDKTEGQCAEKLNECAALNKAEGALKMTADVILKHLDIAYKWEEDT